MSLRKAHYEQNDNKLEVLEKSRWILRPLFDPACDPRFLRYFSILLAISFAFTLFAATMSLFENVENLAEVTQSLFVVTTITLALVMWLTTLHHKQRISDILKALQDIVDASKYSRRRWIWLRSEPIQVTRLSLSEANSPMMHFYRKAERISSIVFQKNAYFMALVTVVA